MTEIIWAAGFWDGEGSVVRTANHNSTRIKMNVSQKDRRPLERFLKAVGVGKIYPQRPNNAWQWSASAKADVIKVYELLSPYLSAPKMEQWDGVLK